MKNELNFKIVGMDCSEEISAIKKALARFTIDENQLNFDLLNGKLTINNHSTPLEETDILTAIQQTGLEAIPWESFKAAPQTEKSQSNSRTYTTLIAFVMLMAGFIFHGFTQGFGVAFGLQQVNMPMPILTAVCYLLASLIGGWFIYPKAWLTLKNKRADINLLMAIAVIGAIAIGQWFEAGSVTVLFSIALLLETWSVNRARKAVQALLDLSPKVAWLKDPITEKWLQRSVKEIAVGQTVMIKPGETVPLDGEITKGQSYINQAPITGESVPILKSIGDPIYAGTLNQEGSLEFIVKHKNCQTVLAQIIRKIEQAQSKRANAEKWVDKFASYYTPTMILIAIAIACFPPLFLQQPLLASIYQGLVILVIACPCALVISTPISIVAGLSCAARHGILIKGGVYLELPAKLKALAFDKTGTLTEGKPTVQAIMPLTNHSQEGLLKIAGALEFYSEHPIASAIMTKAKQQNILIQAADDFSAITGKGIEGKIDGQYYWMGSHKLLLEKGTSIDIAEAEQAAKALEQTAHTVVIIGRDNHVCGLIGIRDPIRPELNNLFADLRKVGLKHLIMLTGDNNGTAQALAEQIDLSEFHAELMPQDKMNHIERMQHDIGEVAMIGDGINDAPAMACANLGIAMGVIGSDVAIETADVSLMTDDLSKLPWLISHSHRVMRVIKQNITFAILIKCIFLILAISGLATLWMAIAADMGASLLVIFNGLRLLRYHQPR